MGRPRLIATMFPGVKRDASGTVWIRGRALDAAGRSRTFGWRQARTQGAGVRVEALAVAEIEERKLAIRSGRATEALHRWTVRTWFEELGRRDKTPAANTTRNRLARSRTWMSVLGDLPLEAVSVVDVERAWAAVVASGVAPSTMRIERTYLRQPFRLALRRGLIPFDPAIAANLPIAVATRSRDRRRYALGHREIAPALARLQEYDRVAPRYRGYFTFVLLSWTLGTRPDELLNARAEDLQGDGRDLWVPPQKEKTGRGRLVRMSGWTRAHLDEHIARRGIRNPADLIFDFSWHGVTARWREALSHAGIPCSKAQGTSIGCLRHACRTTLESLGCRVRLVNLFLGHGDQDVTDTYSLSLLGEMDTAAKLIADYARRGLEDVEAALNVTVDPAGYDPASEYSASTSKTHPLKTKAKPNA